LILQPFTGMPPGVLEYHSPSRPRATQMRSTSVASSSIGASAAQSNVRSSVILSSCHLVIEEGLLLLDHRIVL
jgi:hypothetical protein